MKSPNKTPWHPGQPERKTFINSRRVLTGAAGMALLGAGIAVGSDVTSQSQNKELASIKQSLRQSEMDQGLAAVTAYDNAKTQAAEMTAAFSESSQARFTVYVLNGKIIQKIPADKDIKGGPPVVYNFPILLSSPSNNLLKDEYIGVQTSTASGAVEITTIPINQEAFSTDLYDPNRPILTVDVSAQGAKGAPDNIQEQLVAANPLDQTILTYNGSPLIPGSIENELMK